MAKQMIFSSADGVTHAASYWRPVQVCFSPGDHTASCCFYGYDSVTARFAGKAAIGTKFYSITPDNYATYFSPASMEGAGLGALKSCYRLAMDAKEGLPPLPGAADTRLSFFAGALDV